MCLSAHGGPRSSHNGRMSAITTPSWRLDDNTPSETLSGQGFLRLSAASTLPLAGTDAAGFAALARRWDDLPPDEHLKDGGRYRFRRHASLVLDESGAVAQRVQRPHWQPTDYNALHGGVERPFAPIHDETLANPALVGLLAGLGRLCVGAAGRALPYVELHQFRIDTAGGIGRPTPEGAHRDGVDYVAVVLVARHAVRGGETRVFEADGPAGLRFTMVEPGTALLLDDSRVIHESTPLQPDGAAGWRNTLVITWRHDGFLDPPA